MTSAPPISDAARDLAHELWKLSHRHVQPDDLRKERLRIIQAFLTAAEDRGRAMQQPGWKLVPQKLSNSQHQAFHAFWANHSGAFEYEKLWQIWLAASPKPGEDGGTEKIIARIRCALDLIDEGYAACNLSRAPITQIENALQELATHPAPAPALTTSHECKKFERAKNVDRCVKCKKLWIVIAETPVVDKSQAAPAPAGRTLCPDKPLWLAKTILSGTYAIGSEKDAWEAANLIRGMFDLPLEYRPTRGERR